MGMWLNTTQMGETKENLAIDHVIANVDENAKYFKESRINGHIVRGYIDPGSESTIDLEVDHARAVAVVFVVPDKARTVPVLIGESFSEQHSTMVKRKDTSTIFEEDKLKKEKNIANHVGFVTRGDTVMGQYQFGMQMHHVNALSRNMVEQEESTEVVGCVGILNIDLGNWIILAPRKDSKLQQIIDELIEDRERVNREQDITEEIFVTRGQVI
ncbi:hypothetical protein Trydic_g9612 [Trypoxylus dichotomus]